jgi:hypothetical protein
MINESKETLKRLDAALNAEDIQPTLLKDNAINELINRWKKLVSEEKPKR